MRCAKVKRFEDLDAIAPALLQAILNPDSLIFKNGIVRRHKITVLMAPLMQIKHGQQLSQWGINPGRNRRKLGRQQVQRLLVVVSKVFVAFDFAIAHEQHGHAVVSGHRIIQMLNLSSSHKVSSGRFFYLTRAIYKISHLNQNPPYGYLTLSDN